MNGSANLPALRLREWPGPVVGACLQDSGDLAGKSPLLNLQVNALESAANAMFITDRMGNVGWANHSFEHLSGFSAGEMLGRNVRLLKSGKHTPDFYRDLWQKILTGHVWQGEVINARKDGRLFTQDQTITPLADDSGRISHFLSIQQDISERKRIETAQAKREARFQALADSALEGVLIHDRGIITDANLAATNILGLSVQELIGRPVLDFTRPKQRSRIGPELKGHPWQAFETEFVRGDGRHLWILVQARMVKCRGQWIGVVAIRDVAQGDGFTARTKVMDRQKAVDMERARVARDMHDELGANLTRIKLLAERLQQEAFNPEQALRHGRKIGEMTQQLAESLDEIVWAVDPLKDRLENLGSYLMSYAQEFLETAGLRCRLDFPEVFPDLRIPAQTRHRVFLAVKEALNNTVKHAEATEVRLRLAVRRGSLVVSVRDNGRGFSSRRPHPGGNGLVNMVSRAAECGGRCRVLSRPGTGTCVRLVLKLV